VTISGGRTVSGWRPDARQKGLWRADVGGLDTRQLYVNDRRANRPTAAIPGTLTLTDTGYTTTNAVPQTWRNPGDIEFVYRYSYVEGRCGVAGISGTPAQTTITMDQPCWGMAKALYGTDALAFVHEAENSPGFLTRPGDWYLDRSRPGHHELLYLRRAGEDMRRATVVAPVLESLVIGNGVHDLGFRGLTFAYATWLAPNSPAGFPAAWSMYMRPEGLHTVPGAVAFHTAERVTFEGNQFTHLGGQGLELSKSSSYNVVSGNVLTDISDGGILIGVVPPDETGTNRGNRISDNWIHRVGVEYRAASGIWDTATQQPLGGNVRTAGELITSLAFGADGVTLYATSAHTSLQRFPITPAAAVTQACRRAGATLTVAQWRSYIADARYHSVCQGEDPLETLP
jgi:hypothetical protein